MSQARSDSNSIKLSFDDLSQTEVASGEEHKGDGNCATPDPLKKRFRLEDALLTDESPVATSPNLSLFASPPRAASDSASV